MPFHPYRDHCCIAIPIINHSEINRFWNFWMTMRPVRPRHDRLICCQSLNGDQNDVSIMSGPHWPHSHPFVWMGVWIKSPIIQTKRWIQHQRQCQLFAVDLISQSEWRHWQMTELSGWWRHWWRHLANWFWNDHPTVPLGIILTQSDGLWWCKHQCWWRENCKSVS